MRTTACRRLLVPLAAVLVIFVATSSAVRAEDAKPAPHVLIISIDGMRPDLMLRSKTPNIHSLFESGAFSFWARTTPHSITLPSHVSMLTGAVPRRHEVEWNVDLPPVSVWPEKANFPKVPTIFEMAKKAGYTTALAAGKSKFDIFNRRDVDFFSVPSTAKGEDTDVRDIAVKMIHEHKPQLMFVHFPSTDNVGHKIGWATPEQMAAIENADACVGDLLKALDEEKLREGTVVLLTSDHGGAGNTHLPDDPRARHITWILNGPGVRKNYDLSRLANLTINTEDTTATACKLLKITPEKPLDGKPVLEALEDGGELVKPAP